LFESYAVYILLGGLLLVVIGYIWLIVRGFHTRWFWGLGLIFLAPIFFFLYIFRHQNRASLPLFVMLVGAGVAVTPFAINFYNSHFIRLGPRERVVDGELHITLTGWDRDDYTILRSRPDTALLQMANPDVTDETLQNLQGMAWLRELDLNNTQVTDEGLLILKKLPNLQTLRLSKTKITDEGFREHLAPLDSLLEVDLRGTEPRYRPPPCAPGRLRRRAARP
jgi:hypothetical protein